MTLQKRLSTLLYGAAAATAVAVWAVVAAGRADFSISLAVALGATVLAFAAAWQGTQFAERMILAPLRNLTRTASFSSGQGYYDLRLQHPHEDELGELVGAINRVLEELSQQVQERQRATSVAEQTERLRGEFLANISHEMRTPLNAIVGLTRVVSLGAKLSDQHRGYLEEVNRAATKLAGLVEDALDFSSLEAGSLDLDHVVISVPTILEGALRHSSAEATRKGLALTQHADSVIPSTLVGDPLRLGQALRILIGNAVKFTEKGSVQVSARLNGPVGATAEIIFEVSDTGVGIPAERHRAIFEPFGQAEGGLDRKHGGTGLGLAIATGLVTVLGGKLQVSSTVGKGSKFFFSLKFPTEVGAARPVEAPATLSGEPDLPPMAVLMAEDNPVNQTVAVSLLETYKHSVDVAENGQQALEMLAEQPYDLVLMDVQMPVMDGLTATAAIRQLEQALNRRTPIVALTAQALKGDRERCLDAGMDAYVAKPIVPGQLWAAIRSAVGDRPVLGPRARTAAPAPVPVSAAAVVQGKLCNTEALLARVGGNRRAWLKIIGQFIETAPSQLADIGTAIGGSDANGLMEAAHKFKGAAANFEATQVVDSALKLENLGRGGATAGAAGEFTILSGHLEALLQELRELTAETV